MPPTGSILPSPNLCSYLHCKVGSEASSIEEMMFEDTYPWMAVGADVRRRDGGELPFLG
jgi:hypothetical protein